MCRDNYPRKRKSGFISCDGSLSERALLGHQCFNKGEYLQAHELFEIGWRNEKSGLSCFILYFPIFSCLHL